MADFREICEQYDIWSNPGVVDIPQDEWIKLPTILGSKPQRSQVYRQAKDSQQVIDKAFNALHAQGKMSFAKHQAQGVNPIFVWRIHPDYYGHQAVISHRGQEVLHVVTIGNSNSIAYVQRQIDKILRTFRKWCRTYYDLKKAHIGFPSLTLLGKDIDSAGISTTAEKVKAITSLIFPRIYKQLETYLRMTGDLRHYIKNYIHKSEPLQTRKTKLLKGAPVKGT
ncbi:unnamed protein product [Penicillium camemberti]|uniref:Str. FM013 n=1 Tax=Penicillium camemberti (strain FM 013) TaxID=1429867 RepID=A0A0G4P583_PENC3|nr:unnamed protein product [Penicillium camemberti]